MNESVSLQPPDNSQNGCNSSANRPTVFVAVHSGAGNHSKANENHNKAICKAACQQAMELLKSNRSAVDAVTAAVVTLEDDESTNAGYGSNLNIQGNVECEASVMDGSSLYFGGVGALSGVKNPVNVANILVKEQAEGPLPFGRVRPSVLVGKGARTYCIDHGIDVNYNMISKSSFKTYNRYKRKCCLSDTNLADRKHRKVEPDTKDAKNYINTEQEFPAISELAQDTVGAICVDHEGNVAAASSSGGIWLKHPGRLGPVTMYGAGCWAQNKTSNKPGVAVVTSGCGEHMMQTILAKTCADGIRSSENLSQSLPQVFKTDFFESEFLSSKSEKMGGALALKFNHSSDSKDVELCWIHSTASFCFAFMDGDQKTPKAVMSHLEEQCIPGHSFSMGGHLVCL